MREFCDDPAGFVEAVMEESGSRATPCIGPRRAVLCRKFLLYVDRELAVVVVCSRGAASGGACN